MSTYDKTLNSFQLSNGKTIHYYSLAALAEQEYADKP